MVYRYQPGGPGQPPQVLSENGGGFCVVTGQPIKFFCPERPFWVRVWRRHQHLGRGALRRVKTHFCHRCKANHHSTYADVICDSCKAKLSA